MLRSGLCRDLGFDAESREENVRRTAEVARMLAEAGTVALVSLISPYRTGRAQARGLHETAGVPFLEVWVATPLCECERRDPKGLYARARAGELARLTGVGDPYEPPESAELVLTPDLPVDQAASRVVDLVQSIGTAPRTAK